VPQPPQLLCPANLAVPGIVGTSQNVTYTAPLQTAGTTPVTIVCAPASGTPFPLGMTPVMCSATDSFNQKGSCSFTVTLTPLSLSALKFVAFGDSVTAGENSIRLGETHLLFVDVANAYPTKLQAKFQMDFPSQLTSTINEGLPAERATTAVGRLPGVLAQHKPQAVLLLDGYNDLLNDGAAAVQPVADAMRDMVRIARGAGVQHVFVSTITPGRAGSHFIPPTAILDTNARIRLMALAEGAVLVDNYNAFIGQEPTLVTDDGLHLTAAGNERLATTFLAAIKATATTTSGPLSVLRR
jgi:lysophospholipase L1-like esterase